MHETPYIELDLNKVKDKYHFYEKIFKDVKIYYAVKANPHPKLLELLAEQGSYFDVASIGEIELLLNLSLSTGKIDASRISYGNTIKKEKDIAKAYNLGVSLFAFDSEAELLKISKAAPKSDVYCRILVDCPGAQWPLSRKFGCEPKMAADLLIQAKSLGLNPRGVSFHVGSQQLNVNSWDKAISQASDVFKIVANNGIEMDLLNLGGGFPIKYCEQIPSTEEIKQHIYNALEKHFFNKKLNLIMEPGRSLVGEAGKLYSEIVLIAKKSENEKLHWLYIDAGKFNGLVETMDEAIRYNIKVPNKSQETQNYIIAGPTCDSADIMYEHKPYKLSKDIKIGDIVEIEGAGAYTSSYASVCFNGFSPIKTYIKS